MKKSSILALAAAGLLLTACAEREEIALEVDNPQGEVLPNGYMALNINLPTTSSTRAANDNFDDGDVDEYAVSDCALLLFEVSGENATEENAVLLNAQRILLPFESTDEDYKDADSKEKDNDNITTSYTAVAKVEGRTVGSKLYALAVLNFKNVMSIGEKGIPAIDGVPVLNDTKTSITFAEFRDKITDGTVDKLTTRGGTRDYFFMTNAVLSNNPGGDLGTGAQVPNKDDIFQLAEMSTERIYESEADAKKYPAGEIFVERAVAKATMGFAENFQAKVAGMDIESIAWTIDNTEPTTYVVRNPGNNTIEKDLPYIGYASAANDNYRFVSHTSVNYDKTTDTPIPTIKKAFRTYWCIDPQYNKDAFTTTTTGGTATTTTTMVAAPTEKIGDEDVTIFWPIYENSSKVSNPTPLYCHENTFDVERQSYGNTTRAVIKVTLKNQPTFYTVNGTSDIYTLDNAITEIYANILNNTNVLNAIYQDLNANKTWETKVDGFTTYFDISYKRNEAGQYAVETLTLKNDVVGPDKLFNTSTNVNKALANAIPNVNEQVVVRQYENGVMYYEARFQHFADDLAPWNTKGSWENPAPTGGSTAKSYPGTEEQRSKNYLGRYGMVRNNWYDVEILAFNKIGLPADPSGKITKPGFDDPNTPDDDIVNYLSAKIHVLSWAKRTQSWGFGL